MVESHLLKEFELFSPAGRIGVTLDAEYGLVKIYRTIGMLNQNFATLDRESARRLGEHLLELACR